MELKEMQCQRCDWTKLEPWTQTIDCTACEWLWYYYLDEEWHLIEDNSIIENNLMPTE